MMVKPVELSPMMICKAKNGYDDLTVLDKEVSWPDVDSMIWLL